MSLVLKSDRVESDRVALEGHKTATAPAQSNGDRNFDRVAPFLFEQMAETA